MPFLVIEWQIESNRSRSWKRATHFAACVASRPEAVLPASLSRQGHPIIAHRFIGEFPAPAGRQRLREHALSRVSFCRPCRDWAGVGPCFPPMNRWAIFNRPCRDEECHRSPRRSTIRKCDSHSEVQNPPQLRCLERLALWSLRFRGPPREGEAPAEPLVPDSVYAGKRLSRSFALPPGLPDKCQDREANRSKERWRRRCSLPL